MTRCDNQRYRSIFDDVLSKIEENRVEIDESVSMSKPKERFPGKVVSKVQNEYLKKETVGEVSLKYQSSSRVENIKPTIQDEVDNPESTI